MLAQIKYRLIAQEGFLYLLGLHWAASLASHLFNPALPSPWPGVMLVVFLLLSFFPYILVLTEIFTASKAFGHVLYWQTPLSLGWLVGAQLVVMFVVSLAFIGSWAYFAPFARLLMPRGVTALAVANLVVVALHALAWAMAFMLLLAAKLTVRDVPMAVPALVAALASLYWLALPATVDVLEFFMSPLAALPGDSLLLAPWPSVWQNAGQVLVVLAVQYAVLLYVMVRGKADCPETDLSRGGPGRRTAGPAPPAPSPAFPGYPVCRVPPMRERLAAGADCCGLPGAYIPHFHAR
ncbi:MAG TPA: hypothetical protein DCM14_08835 [Clostridiales bacterium UBA8153]|nr:hypothetical protein [Clostridiales bacterium UBA8153]